MIDRRLVTEFDGDEGNARKSAEKHGVSRGETEQTFFNEPLVLLRDDKRTQREPRFHALGETGDGRHRHITFTCRAVGTLIRVISARDMHRKERIIYRQAKQESA